MDCKKCGTELFNTDISVRFTELNGMENIDVCVECPECGKDHWKFINVEDLSTSD